MKRTLSLLLAVLLCFSCFMPAGAAVLTRSAAGYKPAYVLTGAVYNGSFDVFSKETYTYDKNFNVIKAVSVSNAGANTHTYSYDAYGRLTKEVSKSDYGTNITQTYKYDSNGKLVKETYRSVYEDGDQTVSDSGYVAYTYDKYGRLKKSAEHNGSSAEVYNTVYTYDSNGNLVKREGGSLTVTYRYDASGNVIRETGKNTLEPAYSYTYTYKYDSAGHRIKTVYTPANGNTDTYVNAFNTAGRIAKETETLSNNGTATYTYAYNANGKVSKRTARWADGSSAQYVYKYDANGNNTKITYTRTYGDSDMVETGTYTYTYKKVTNTAAVINDNVQQGYLDFTYRVGYASTAYNGKAKKPAVTVTNSYAGESGRLIKGRDYRVKYINNVKPGKAQVKIIFTYSHQPVVITFDVRPLKPTELKAAAKTKTSVTLTWNKVTGAQKYIVYKYVSSTGKYVKLATVTANKAVIKDLKANTAYQFCVRAVAAGGVKGALSAKLTVRTAK